MNAPAQNPNAPAPVKRPPVTREDSDFLPAALEILETPPSPTRTAFLITICAFVTGSLIWAYFGHIDIIASARGKIQAAGRTKIIQPFETGKVAAVLVQNGQSVKAGDVVLELDTTDAKADEAAATAGLYAYRSEALRRSAALDAVARPNFRIVPVAWPRDFPETNRIREDRVLLGDVGQLSAAVGSFDAQIRQKDAERKRLEGTISSQKDLIDVLQQRVDLRAKLVVTGAGPLTSLIDAKENLNFHTSNYTTSKGQLQESVAGVDVLKSDRAKTIEGFVAEQRQKLAEAERQSDDFEQKQAKARARLSHLTFRSPIDGTIASTTVTTPGQVVTVGEEVVRITPDDAVLEIEAYLENKDIGFVKVGQEAHIKIESFPFTRYGTVPAKVLRVASDAIPDQDATSIEGDPAKATKSSGFAGAQRTQNLVFPVTLKPGTTVMNAGDTAVPLSPGMSVTVEILTGHRRILEYIFSPLVETGSKALKER